jgi:cysteine desulfurase
MSTQPRIYLDFNATAPLLPAAAAAMAEALAGAAAGGNPSSLHGEGRAARDRVERARGAVAGLLARPREQVVLTSGGTEANALGVAACAARPRPGRAPVAWYAPIDHPSLCGVVRALAAAGWAVRALAVDGDGRVVVPAADEPADVIAVGWVNHELGVVQDIDAIAAWARAAGARLHVDAVQAAGKLPLGALAGADAVAISAHKLGGPSGVGAVALAGDATPPTDAGHQERGRRAGTENVVGIAGFGAAAAAAEPAAWTGVAALGEVLERGLVALGARIHAGAAARVGGTINAAFPGARGESIAIALDLAGVAVSTGAACTSGSIRPSAVLLALGLDDARAREGVRFSLGRPTTRAEIDAVLALLPAIVARARR